MRDDVQENIQGTWCCWSGTFEGACNRELTALIVNETSGDPVEIVEPDAETRGDLHVEENLEARELRVNQRAGRLLERQTDRMNLGQKLLLLYPNGN